MTDGPRPLLVLMERRDSQCAGNVKVEMELLFMEDNWMWQFWR
jgi:hypothetical protein